MASRKCRFTARKNMPFACSSIRTRWPLARSASTKSATQSTRATRTCRQEHSGAVAKLSLILSNGKLQNASQFGPMIVAYRNGAPVRISDIGRAIDSVQDDKSASWFNGNRAIVLAILRQPGTNTVEVVDSVKQLLPQLEAQIPGRRSDRHPIRPLRLDSRLGRRREVHPHADHRIGRHGDLPLPAQHLGDHHSGPRLAACPSSAPSR